MEAIVNHLCSPECLPRNPGTDGGIAARSYLRDGLENLELEPAGEHGFDQHIPSIGGANLLATVPGGGERYVLLAAHYDACGPDNPGADDNAAAVAVALNVAQQLQNRHLDRSVVIALFDAEEPPYFQTPNMGPQWFVDHPTVPLAEMDMMVCLDLVGHALGSDGMPREVRESIFVLGTEKSTGTDTPDRLDYDKMAGPANHLVDLPSDHGEPHRGCTREPRRNGGDDPCTAIHGRCPTRGLCRTQELPSRP
jgi:hypothetical protein